MPHGMCYLWEPELLWLHVLSDGAVALAYFLIPPGLVVLTLRARDQIRTATGDPGATVPFGRLFWAFAVFIISCGVTHVLGVVTVWKPIYWVSGTAKAVTATASVFTAAALFLVIPRATELFASHAKLQRRTDELEAANADLERMAREVQEAQEARETSLRVMAGWLSHDLNNRLQGIQGGVDLMAERDLADEELRVVREEVRRAADTIGTLQVIAGTTLRPDPQVVEVTPVVREVAASLGLAPGSVDAPTGLRAQADPGHLRRIVTELVSNALEGDPEGRVSVRVEERPGTVAIVVLNPAPGLDPDFVRDMFEPFTSRREGRSGLGLTIATRLASEMGGELVAGLSGGVLSMTLRLQEA